MNEQDVKAMFEVFGVKTTPMSWSVAKQLIAGFEASKQTTSPPHTLTHIHLVAMAYQLGYEQSSKGLRIQSLDAIDRACLESIRDQVETILTRRRTVNVEG